jgi:hypothetical protein
MAMTQCDLSMKPSPDFLPRKSNFVVGVDIGQAVDPTAVAVVEHITGVIDGGSDYERHCGLPTEQKPAERVDVRHLQRLPLGLSYPNIVQRVKDLMARPPLCGDENRNPAGLIIDETGVGRAVGDIFNEAGLSPIRVSITGGNEATYAGEQRWHVAKTILISTVDAMLHRGVLRFAASLSEAPAMKDELQDFRRKLSDAGRATYAARIGAHDDLVLAVAIAAWWISRPPPQMPVFGRWGTPSSVRPDTYGSGENDYG